MRSEGSYPVMIHIQCSDELKKLSGAHGRSGRFRRALKAVQTGREVLRDEDFFRPGEVCPRQMTLTVSERQQEQLFRCCAAKGCNLSSMARALVRLSVRMETEE